MRLMTVRQPWAWAIIHAQPPKTVENRPRVWSHVGTVGVHAAKEWDLHGLEDPALLDALQHAGLDPDRVRHGLEGHLFPTSAVVGVVDMIGGHRSDEGCCPGNPWARRPARGVGYIGHHALRRPRPIDPVTDVRGNVTLWRADPELLTRIVARLPLEGSHL